MKNIIKSLVIVFAVAAVAGVATYSYFTDQVVVASNTVGAGKIDIAVNAKTGSTLPFAIANIAPGECKKGAFFGVYNQNTPLSTLPVKYRFQDQFVSQTASGFYSKLNAIVRHTFAGTPNPEAWPIVYQGTLNNLLIDSTSTSGVIASSLGVNITHDYYMEVCLDSSAGNTLQGASATFDLVFDATQTDNPSWTQ